MSRKSVCCLTGCLWVREYLIFIFQSSIARKAIQDQASEGQSQGQGPAELCHSQDLDRSHVFAVGVKTVNWKDVVNDDISLITQLLLFLSNA